ncbi:Astacin-like metalloendopeptidase [Aphelenchoides besseyi]|nr:Astacin-like metalloendopeptidase [Aphelenchoides besseyi]KAI6193005.1 Astacin-like metalloendopeptidase [Aphelenchoides besseyi]
MRTSLDLFVILFLLFISLSRGQDDAKDPQQATLAPGDPDLPPTDNTEAPPSGNTESPVAGDTDAPIPDNTESPDTADTDAPDNTQQPTTLATPEQPTDRGTTQPSTVGKTQQPTTPRTTTTTTTTTTPKPFDPCTCKSLVEARALLRSNNPESTDHFYTIDAQEQQEIVSQGFRIERAVGFVATKTAPECPGLVPLHRLWNPVIRNHFYTTNDNEMQNARDRLGYTVETNMGFCSSKPGCGLVPLYRFYNVRQPDHFYTNRKHEKNHVQRNQPEYHFEGIQCYVYA